VRQASEGREHPPRVELALEDGQRHHIHLEPRAQRLPAVAGQARDAIREDPAGAQERPGGDEIPFELGQREDAIIEPAAAAERAPGAPLPGGDARGELPARGPERAAGVDLPLVGSEAEDGPVEAGACLAVAPGLVDALLALRVLSGVGYGVLRPVLRGNTAVGAQMRRKLEPVLGPLERHLAVLMAR